MSPLTKIVKLVSSNVKAYSQDGDDDYDADATADVDMSITLL